MDPAQLALTGFRSERGLLWPDYDEVCARVTFREVDAALPRVLAHLPLRRAVVQAGGNVGPMVRRLAALFDAVYTFEPDPMNFVALTVNTAAHRNVHRYQAALGSARVLTGLAQGDAKNPANCAGLYADGSGSIPTLMIDDLGLPICDLLLLDVEGAECQALVGAEETLAQCRPVVVIESKGLGARFFGEAADAAEHYLADRGYRRAEKVKADLIMVHQ